MLNVPDLERRWQRYRRSKRIPYFAAGVLVSAAVAGSLYLYFTPVGENVANKMLPSASATIKAEMTSRGEAGAVTPSEAVDNRNPPSPHAPLGSLNNAAVAAAPQPQTVTKQPTKLTPSMHFMNDFESDVMDYYFNDVTTTAQKESPKHEPTPKPAPERITTQNRALPTITPESSVPPAQEVVLNAPAPKQEVPVQPVIQKASEPNQMVIQRDDDMKDIQDVIARFKKNKNPALSLFVAKRYYKIGNYQQAYNYALITNELDNNIEDSWLIFAKSLYKLDQKDMAIKTLKAYIQESSSVKARITLDQMEKGTF